MQLLEVVEVQVPAMEVEVEEHPLLKAIPRLRCQRRRATSKITAVMRVSHY